VLIILTIMVLFSVNTSLFEQRSAQNENRARMVEQAAEYAINLAGEYLKGKRNLIISKAVGDTVTGGWLATTTATGKKWVLCSATPPAGHVCNAEPNPGRRAQMYFYSADGTNASAVPYRDLTPDASELETKGVGFETVSGTGNFTATTRCARCFAASTRPCPSPTAPPSPFPATASR
jgi:Tfp pilus assembly protein PilX